MRHSDYEAHAELYLGRDWHTASTLGPRRFGSAAKALRFAFEHAAPVSLRGARLRIGNRIYAGPELAALYADHHYPLPRKGADADPARH